ncbi:MAG: thiolase family protein [Dehalococcoidia bacterium]|nr:thiolase family protein [Dehalococcoidia bacterium]
MDGLKHRYCIVGVGNTPYGRNPGLSQMAHNVLAIRAALEDAGLSTSDVDGVLTKTPTSTFPGLWSTRVAEALRVVPRVTATIDQAGASNIGLIQFAIGAIEAGQASVVVCSYGDNPATGSRSTYAKPRGEAAAAGLFGAPSAYAMAARRHMAMYGTTHEQLGNVAIAHRYHASLNPNAHFQEPISMEDYQNSRWLAEPFRLLDCCPVSDSGAAWIVTTEERARDLKQRPIYIEGLGQGHPAWDFHLRPDITVSGAKVSGEMAFKSAGLGPEDMDFAELYDCFTIVPIITLEDYGFVPKGEGGAFYEDRRTYIGGEFPINTSGGLLSETGMPGPQHILEAVRQLRHEYAGTNRQVEGAEVGLVSQQGGIMTTHATMILANA